MRVEKNFGWNEVLKLRDEARTNATVIAKLDSPKKKKVDSGQSKASHEANKTKVAALRRASETNVVSLSLAFLRGENPFIEVSLRSASAQTNRGHFWIRNPTLYTDLYAHYVFDIEKFIFIRCCELYNCYFFCYNSEKNVFFRRIFHGWR